MSNRTIPEPWYSFFKEIDSWLEEETVLEILGGFVITQVYGSPRTTADIDVVSINPRRSSQKLMEIAGEGSSLHKKYKVYLDSARIAPLPEYYEDRLMELVVEFYTNLRLFVLDPYDIALAKIERNIQRDRDDVKYLARIVPFDLEVLKERYEKELRPILGNPSREDLTIKLWIDAIQEERKAQ
jgi:hypothetical protein